MMRRLLTATAMVALAGTLAGCQTDQNGERAELESVPPPPYETQTYDPVTVEPSEVEPAPQAQPQAQSSRSQQPPTLDLTGQPPQPDASGRPDTYTIRKGDTLWSIARRFYGSDDPWQHVRAIIRANPNIQNPDEIREGQTLVLPDVGE